jgi:hypothetical protein
MDGTIHLAEIHWYEAAGIGRSEYKIKYLLMLRFVMPLPKNTGCFGSPMNQARISLSGKVVSSDRLAAGREKGGVSGLGAGSPAN